ncbi:hypothetical protein D3C81_1787600 [compost metagenome]
MPGCQIEAGQVGGRQVLQGFRLEDHVEVGLEAVPVDRAQAGDLHLALQATNGEGQLVAEFELEAQGQLGFH